MIKDYTSELFPNVKKEQIAIQYFCLNRMEQKSVPELRKHVRRISSDKHQSTGIPSYELYKPTSEWDYPGLVEFLKNA
jgi:hypothetical protein